jgi:glycosyltransferase involved in cell wall biosynthesis
VLLHAVIIPTASPRDIIVAMPAPGFTLVIPTYQRPDLVAEAVASALAQVVAFDRIIVVCDGDQPAVRDRLAGLPVEVVTVAHGGVAAARNHGLSLVDTSWVCFLDDDNLLHPDYLASVHTFLHAHDQVSALNTYYWVFAASPVPGIDFVAADGAQCLARSASTTPVSDLSYLHIAGQSYRLLLERLRGSVSGCAVSAEVLRAAGGFPEGRTCAEDWTMFVNVSRLTEWHVIQQRLVFFRDHPLTNTRTGLSANGLDTVRAMHEFWTDPRLHEPCRVELADYRAAYRSTVRFALEAARVDQSPERFAEIRRLTPVVLPRRIDRLLASIPPRWWDRLKAAKSLFAGRRREADARVAATDVG